jgi:hypothetical protein
VLVGGSEGRGARGELTKKRTGRKMMISARRARSKGRPNSIFFGVSSVRARLASEWPIWPKAADDNILIHAVRRAI